MKFYPAIPTPVYNLVGIMRARFIIGAGKDLPLTKKRSNDELIITKLTTLGSFPPGIYESVENNEHSQIIFISFGNGKAMWLDKGYAFKDASNFHNNDFRWRKVKDLSNEDK